MTRRQQPIKADGRLRLQGMNQEELIEVVSTLANHIADIDATCNRHAMPGEFTVIGDCGCCGENTYSRHKLTPHRPGCVIDTALTYCRSGFKDPA